MGKVVMYASVSVDGFIADENDQPGPLFDWLVSGDVPLDESGALKVSRTSYDYVRPYWDQRSLPCSIGSSGRSYPVTRSTPEGVPSASAYFASNRKRPERKPH